MKLKLIIASILPVFFVSLSASGASKAVEIVDEIEDLDQLMSLMTLEEKVGQMVQYNGSWDVTGPLPSDDDGQSKYKEIKAGLVGSMLNVLYYEDTMRMQKHAVENTRLGIPLIFGHDVIHGFETMFPLPLAEAASFNLSLIEKSARYAAVEASAAGLHWTFAPMVDVGRDARWGRVMEGAGEDTWWGSQVAAARVHGFQGDDLSLSDTIVACAKHFAGYGYIEAGRDYNHSEISAWRLKNDIFPPFEACVDAGVGTFMNSFTTILGVPATASHYLLRETLQDDWGFEGFVVSDWASIAEMVTHGFAENLVQAAQIGANAGSHMDMEGRAYSNYLVDLVREGKVSEAVVDDAVRRILKVKFDLGLFEDPYRYHDEDREKTSMRQDIIVDHTRKIATESIVLLKNEKSILPLSLEKQTIAVIGPLANDKDAALGNWRSQAVENSAISLYEGLESVIPDEVKLVHHYGCILNEINTPGMFSQVVVNRDRLDGIADAVKVAEQADVIIAAVGEVARMSGEARSYSDIRLAGVQSQLLDALFATGKPVIVVLFNGRPLAIPEIAEQASAIVEAWQLGDQAGHAIADVLVGNYNPSGKLPMSFPRNVGQIPIYYNHFNTGRPGDDAVFGAVSHYEDVSNDALYPFGYGLSYSQFEYSEIELSTETIKVDGSIKLSVTVHNSSEVDGEEVVQLYIHDKVASAVRPVRELKGIEKVMIAAGKTETVTFELTSKELGFYRPDLTWAVEPGEFDVYVGGSSVTENRSSFQVVQ